MIYRLLLWTLTYSISHLPVITGEGLTYVEAFANDHTTATIDYSGGVGGDRGKKICIECYTGISSSFTR